MNTLDMNNKEKPFLYVDLIPKTSWLQNLRKELKQKEWNIIRKDVYLKAKNKCVVCGGRGKKHPVEAHERWNFDDASNTQTLTGIDALCPMCHKSTHIGFASGIGLYEPAFYHLKRVNKWKEDEVEDHIEKAFSLWAERSEKSWKIDMSWILKEYGHILSEESRDKFKKLSLS